MESLEQRVWDDGPLTVRDAIGWVVRTATAIEPIHAELGAHGAISAAAIRVRDTTCSSDGALLVGADAPERLSYHSLARGEEGEPSCADDTWALTVLLYFLLTGTEPFTGGVASARNAQGAVSLPQPLGMHDRDIAVMQPLMDELFGLRRGWTPLPDALILAADLLAFSPATANLPALPLQQRSALEGEAPRAGREEATDDEPAPAPDVSMPDGTDELPSSATPIAPAQLDGAPPRRLDRRPHQAAGRLVWLAAALAFIGGVALVLTRPRSHRELTTPLPSDSLARSGSSGPSPTTTTGSESHGSAAAAASGSRAIGDGRGAAAGRSELQQHGLARCALPLLAAELVNEPDLDFVCQQPDARKALRTMTATIARGHERQQRAAAKAWLSLGWYQMAALALARRHCCTAPTPLLAPRRLAGCRLGQALDGLRRAEGEAAFLTALGRYTRSVSCVANTWPQGFRYVGNPSLVQQSALLRKRSHTLSR